MSPFCQRSAGTHCLKKLRRALTHLGLGLSALVSMADTSAAPFEDSMAQRVLACTGCHGAQGRSAPDGYYPRIAGKPAGYLHHQLQNFRDGRRLYGPMARLIEPLDDRYLRDISEHFESLDLPYAAPPASDAPGVLLAQGRSLALHGDAARQLPACTACHGPALTGVAPSIPGLLGLPRDYLLAQIGAWRTGSRHAHAPDCMARVARRLAPDDVTAISHWLASQPVPVGARPLPSVSALPAPIPLECGGVVAEPKAVSKP